MGIVGVVENASGSTAVFSPDSRSLALASGEGQLSPWKTAGDCWAVQLVFSTERGTKINTLAFSGNGKFLIGSRVQDPPRLQIWDTPTGLDTGVDCRTGAHAIIERNNQVLLVRERGVEQFDLSHHALIKRLCDVATPAIRAGLTANTSDNVCLSDG